MNRKRIVAVLGLVALIATGAFGQIMFGITGALPMDTKMSASAIQDAFQNDNGIWYGGFGEIAFGKLGFGVSANFTAPYLVNSYNNVSYVDMDIAGYVSYHLFRARSFLDPFGELGVGYIGTDYASDSDSQAADPNPDDPIVASMYWYGALGLGINLGPIGVFGKFAYNNAMKRHLKDSTDTDIPYYGPWNWEIMDFDQYVPAFRFTLGAKLIL